MVWAVFEVVSDATRVMEWALYIVQDGRHPDPQGKPFATGYWLFDEEDRDPAGYRSYVAAFIKAREEVARLNAEHLVSGQ